jgi:hypothetical protein
VTDYQWNGNTIDVPTEGTGLPYWDDRDDPLAWDTLILDGEIWPGVCEISGAGVSRKVDVKKGKGEDGATIKDEGYDLARLSITLTIYSEGDWVQLQRLLPTIHPRRKGGTRTPIEIVNPQCNLLGVSTIYIDKISIPKKPKSGDGLVELEMSAIEWVPDPPPVKGGAGTGTGANTDTGYNKTGGAIPQGTGTFWEDNYWNIQPGTTPVEGVNGGQVYTSNNVNEESGFV